MNMKADHTSSASVVAYERDAEKNGTTSSARRHERGLHNGAELKAAVGK